ncbi:MAG TPA: sigma-70 family RNA polymerase sigma factor [Cellulomonas sp.]
MTDLVPEQRSSSAADFEEFYRAHVSLVRGYAERHVGPDLADDVVAETFAAVWHRWGTLPAPEGERRAWTFGAARIAIPVVVRRGRGSRPSGPAATEAAEQSVVDHADRVVDDDRVSRLLSALPPREFDAMWLVVWVDLTPTAAALALGCSVTALTSRLARGRRHLKALLAAEAHAEQGVHRVG